MIDTGKVDVGRIVNIMLRILNLGGKKENDVAVVKYKTLKEILKYTSPEKISKYGFCLIINGNKIICINEKQPRDEKLFTTAHEIGHLLLHDINSPKELSEEETEYSEWETDMFASMLLFIITGSVPIMEHYSLVHLKKVGACHA